jgi:hypothetical protein
MFSSILLCQSWRNHDTGQHIYCHCYFALISCFPLFQILHCCSMSSDAPNTCVPATTFLNAELKEDIYLKQPAGFEDPEHSNWVWKLEKALYGLKQASYEWNQTLDEYLWKEGLDLSGARLTIVSMSYMKEARSSGLWCMLTICSLHQTPTTI